MILRSYPYQKNRVVVDLFCGEGGASKGYADAGYKVVGVDSDPERINRYPYDAYCGDWIDGLHYWLKRLDNIVLIHASPPCQRYTKLAKLHPDIFYPDLIPPVRQALLELYESFGIHYIIENVPPAPLIDPVTLCGSHFQLVDHWKGELVGLRRHRNFEVSFPIHPPLDCDHQKWSVPVYGHGKPAGSMADPRRGEFWGGKGFAALTKSVMGIDWASRRGLTEAIPPRYSEYIAHSLQVHTGAWNHSQGIEPWEYPHLGNEGF